ncbi:hypothetical protein [Bacillus cereus]|uniref:hypothetical protein n=1 Tax=Bacillus cereus TaxID=1396 RepID=UPI0037BE49AB
MSIISDKEYNADVIKHKSEQPTDVHNAPVSSMMVMVFFSNELMKLDGSYPYEFTFYGQ